jgi:hypothetical protein
MWFWSLESFKKPFLYHLGDIVYEFEASEYYSQFYEPYAHYPAPISTIPGNKDGDVRVNTNENSLERLSSITLLESRKLRQMQVTLLGKNDTAKCILDIRYSICYNYGALLKRSWWWRYKRNSVSMIGEWAPTDKAMILSVHH